MRNLGAIAFIVCAACGPAGRDGGGGDDGGGGVDAGDGSGSGSGSGDVSVTFVYAHTAGALYKVDPDTLAITMIGNFVWSNGNDSMTDIAINKTGLMIGVSSTAVYRVDVTNAHATRLATGLTGQFNGLSFIPADQVGQTGDDILVGTRAADGVVTKIDPNTGQQSSVGNMGSFASSGDLVAVKNFGTVQTADNGLSPDRLVRLAPQTFAATPIGSTIGFSNIYGVAYWKDKIFGFTSGGEFVTIDPTTGVGTLVQGNGPAWWGAAVTTSAPVIF